ncbi:hypothetical protein B0H14DRAFT_3568781 [Mycena olivaceomarginata]|nr:hypothetical protein B0H14DRAFT_3568781 [Mycena olivaceomarginata]
MEHSLSTSGLLIGIGPNSELSLRTWLAFGLVLAHRSLWTLAANPRYPGSQYAFEIHCIARFPPPDQRAEYTRPTVLSSPMAPMQSRPSTPASGLPPASFSSEIKDKFHLSSRRKAQLRTACSGLKTVLETAKGVADNAGVPGLSMSVGKKMGQNAEDIEALSVRMKHLMDILEAVSPVKTRPKEGLSGLRNSAEEVKPRKSGGFFKRLLNHEEDVLWVSDRIKVVAEAIGDFKLDTAVRTEAVVDNIQEEMHLQEILSQRNLFFITLRAYIFQGFHMLPRRTFLAEGKGMLLGYHKDQHSSPKFPSGINIDGVQLVPGEPSSTETVRHDEPCIFWMNGAAGTGKTTIAATVRMVA